MGVWLKFTGDPESKHFKWFFGRVKTVTTEQNGTWEDGVFSALVSGKHLASTKTLARKMKISLKELSEPPNRLTGCADVAHSQNGVTSERRVLSEGQLRVLKNGNGAQEHLESGILVLGTDVADIRKIAEESTKGDIAKMLGVTVRELNGALKDLNVEPPIYFLVRCGACGFTDRGEHAHFAYMRHARTCAARK